VAVRSLSKTLILSVDFFQPRLILSATFAHVAGKKKKKPKNQKTKKPKPKPKPKVSQNDEELLGSSGAAEGCLGGKGRWVRRVVSFV